MKGKIQITAPDYFPSLVETNYMKIQMFFNWFGTKQEKWHELPARGMVWPGVLCYTVFIKIVMMEKFSHAGLFEKSTSQCANREDNTYENCNCR